MRDGLYIVSRGSIYAAFVLRGGEVTSCAPVLRRNLAYYMKIARFVPTAGDPISDEPLPAGPRGADLGLPFPESEPQYPPAWRSGFE